jgi:hypothetical protein
MPKLAMMSPASAGPMARLMLMPTLHGRARQELRHDGLPGGCHEGGTGARDQREGDQHPGIDLAHEDQEAERSCGDREERHDHEEQPPAVDQIGEGAGGQGQKKDRCGGGGLDQGHHQG